MKLIDPTLDELDAVFAENVAMWKLFRADGKHGRARYNGAQVFSAGGVYRIINGGKEPAVEKLPYFTRSFDAVLPWLEKHTWRGCSYRAASGSHFSAAVEVVDNQLSLVRAESSKSLSHAGVIALLRAHGVEVVFTKETN